MYLPINTSADAISDSTLMDAAGWMAVIISVACAYFIGRLVKPACVVLRPRKGKSAGNDGSTIAYDTCLEVFTLSTSLLLATSVASGGGGPYKLRYRAGQRTAGSLRPSRVHQSPARVRPTRPGQSLVRDGQNAIRPVRYPAGA